MPITGRHTRFVALVGVLAAVLLAMALLYMLGMGALEGKPRTYWQALQWAAGTMSTTGYSPDTSWTHPVMVVYVVVAQFTGVALFFVVLPLFLVPVLEERFETRLPTQAAGVRDYVVIFDHDETVATLLGELSQAGIASVIVDEDEGQARHLLAQGHRVVHGSLDEGVLARCELAQARALIVNSSDERNASAILAARQLGYGGEIIAMVEDPFHRHPVMLAGASEAYTPRHLLGAALAARASPKVSPTVAGIQHLGDGFEVAEARITRDSELAGRTLAQAGLGRHTGVTVIGQWVGGRLVAPPTPDMTLEPGGVLVLVGSGERLREFMERCAGARRLRRQGRFVIAGFGEVGHKVNELLRDAGEETLTIDSRAAPGVDVVGNVLDIKVLERAGLEDAQAVVLALSSDSAAVFASVIVRDLAPDVPVIARVNLAENVERMYVAGADFALSVSQVSGQLLAYRLLGKESVAVDAAFEVVKVSARGLESRPPSRGELRERTGCSVIAVERDGELLVELGDDFRFERDDAAYVCGSGQATQRFREMFPQRA
ncbi:MAG: NAD-binding protein [Burkholderiaceae bacterium]